MLAETPVEEFAATLDRCAEDALWEGAVDRPPVDAFALARRLGLEVAEETTLTHRARFVRPQQVSTGRALIVVAPDTRPERRHWAVAHELGEWLAGRVFELLGVRPQEAPSLSREGIANALAGRLLAPRRWLHGVYLDSDGDLFALKRCFATASHELLVRRLLECVTPPLAAAVYDHGRLAWRRWNRPGAPPPVVSIEADCQRFAHDTSEPANSGFMVEPPILRTRCWPVHEPDWKREVVLSECVDEFDTDAW